MKILVMVKQVPDTATQVKISADPKKIDTTGITWIVSPYDEFAVEEALRIKEKRGQGEVVAVPLGPARAKEALRSTGVKIPDLRGRIRNMSGGQRQCVAISRAAIRARCVSPMYSTITGEPRAIATQSTVSGTIPSA